MVTHVLSHWWERFANFDVIFIRECHFNADLTLQCSRYAGVKESKLIFQSGLESSL